MLREHEKFWAFIALLVCIVVISLPSLIGDVDETKLTLADKVIVGLIGVLGTVAGALFSRNADHLAETVRHMATQHGTTQKVEVTNEPGHAIPVTTEPPPQEEELPEYAR